MRYPLFENIQVGDELPSLQMPAVNRSMLALFAGASGDHNPVHIDTDFARRAGMPDVFAQGMLGMAWVARLITDWAPQSALRRFDVRFLGITHLGNEVRCRGRVVEKVVIDEQRFVRLEVSSVNQYGQPKISGEALIAFPEKQDAK